MALENTFSRQAWYRAYCAAMLETDASRIRDSVEFARKVIQDRAFELRDNLSTGSSESRELDRALRFLSMLLDYFGGENQDILFASEEYRTNLDALAGATQ